MSDRADDSRGKKQPKYLWHIDLHQRVAHEKLLFIWVSFKGLYNENRASEQIRSAIRSQNIRSYAVWELLGERDVLIKAYMPAEEPKESVRQALLTAIKAPHRVTIEIFSVDITLMHWMWKKVPDRSEFYASVEQTHRSGLNRGVKVTRSKIEEYKAMGYIVPIIPRSQMKFFARIPEPEDVVVSEDQVEGDLRTLLKRTEGSGVISGMALYKGDGASTRYLVTGWIDPSRWNLLLESFNSKVNSLGLRAGWGKTITSVSARPGPIDRREQLEESDLNSGDAGFQVASAEDLLELAEFEQLEFKGSFYTDINKWIFSGEKSKSDEVFGEIVSAVAALLNQKGAA